MGKKNVGESVFARLRNKAREDGVDLQSLLVRYVLERMLFRIGASRHKDALVLKGAMLFVAWTNNPHRHTADVDLHGDGEDFAARSVEAVMREVLSATPEVDDGVVFETDTLKVHPIREGFIPGTRVIGRARVHTAVVKLKADVGFGDAVTPKASLEPFPTIIDLPAPRILLYPRETVVAEKFHAVVDKGLENTRLKDFFDLWVLSETFPFDGRLLAEAIRATFATRETALPEGVPDGLSETYVDLNAAAWRRYLARDSRTLETPSLDRVVLRIQDFVLPAVAAAGSGATADSSWEPGRGWCAAAGCQPDPDPEPQSLRL